jgi:hypothetical protein
MKTIGAYGSIQSGHVAVFRRPRSTRLRALRVQSACCDLGEQRNRRGAREHAGRGNAYRLSFGLDEPGTTVVRPTKPAALTAAATVGL